MPTSAKGKPYITDFFIIEWSKGKSLLVDKEFEQSINRVVPFRLDRIHS